MNDAVQPYTINIAEDAFHIVCPSLPGFGFSDKPVQPGWNVEKIGHAWGELMHRLGYGCSIFPKEIFRSSRR